MFPFGIHITFFNSPLHSISRTIAMSTLNLLSVKDVMELAASYKDAFPFVLPKISFKIVDSQKHVSEAPTCAKVSAARVLFTTHLSRRDCHAIGERLPLQSIKKLCNHPVIHHWKDLHKKHHGKLYLTILYLS